MAITSSRGVILIHSAPRALCPHLEWAVDALSAVPSTSTGPTSPC